MSAPSRRIVHCVRSDSFSGVERYVATVAPALARRGWHVRVIGGDPTRMRAELGPDVQFTGGATTLAVASALVRFDRGTLVHAHMTAAEAAAVAGRFARRYPLVVTRHFTTKRGSSLGGRLAAGVIARAVDRQISISHFVADAIREPSTVILNGVPDIDTPSAPERIVLVAQRFEPEKGTQVALRAWAEAHLRDEGWQLVLAGRGSEEGELRSLASHLGVSDTVDFVGLQSDMTKLMSRAGIFLAPMAAEPFGLSVVEAMAAGVPVIAASGGGHLETVGAASDRWLFPVNDARAAAGMLDDLGADPSERRAYGAALRWWQRTHLSIERHVDELESVYAELGR